MKKSIAAVAMAACMSLGVFGAAGVATAKTSPTPGSSKKCRDIPAGPALRVSTGKPPARDCTEL